LVAVSRKSGSGDTICAGGHETITVSVKVTGRATRGLGRTLLGAIAREKRRFPGSGFRFPGSRESVTHSDNRKLAPPKNLIRNPYIRSFSLSLHFFP